MLKQHDGEIVILCNLFVDFKVAQALHKTDSNMLSTEPQLASWQLC